jgi:hypothetical protein
VKREAIGHTKMKKLCRILRCDICLGVGILESLWHLTAREAYRGDIGRLTNEDIAMGIGYSKNIASLLQALVDSKWLDVSGEHRLIVHDWSDHADDSIQSRLARARVYFADGRAPKLGKLSKDEREKAEKWYLDDAGARREKTAPAGELQRPTENSGALPVPLPVPLPEPVPEPEGAAPLAPDTPEPPARKRDPLPEITSEPTLVQFKALAIEYGMQVSAAEWREFEAYVWPKQDWTQRHGGIRGLEDRIKAGDYSLRDATPKNFMEQAYYERRIRAPVKQEVNGHGNSLEEKARQHRENKQRILEGKS